MTAGSCPPFSFPCRLLFIFLLGAQATARRV
jgi:hypothetical protein